jgi:DNA polymerase I-like protein with 3'-5' exonuclease and polymerase domains
MKLRDNDIGLLWDRSIRPERSVSVRQAKYTPPPPPMPDSNWSAPTDLPDIPRTGRMAVDVETKDPQLSDLGPGVRRPGNYVVGVAIGLDDGRRWYFPVRHEGGGNIDEGLVWRWAREELNAFRGTVLGANLSYDLDWLAENGVTFPHVEGFDDVQIAEPLIDEWRYSYSLDALAHDYLGERKVDGLLAQAAKAMGWTTEKQIKGNLWRLPAAYVGAYAEGDVDLPLRIFPLQRSKLEAESLETVYSIERRLIPILVAMRRRGVRVDIEKTETVRAQLVAERDRCLAHLRSIAGASAEFMQPGTFVKALQDRGLKIPLTPKTQQPSIKAAFFEQYKNDELVGIIARGRQVNTIINTFLDGHILGHHLNGRIHCVFNQLKNENGRGTIARLSSESPNLQNIPSRDKIIGPMIRGIFVPENGEMIQKDDYSQVEYRLLTHFAVGPGAEEARQKYRDDPKTDFHKFCMSMMGIASEDAVGRGRVKGVNFCKVYGGGIGKLALVIGASFEDAEKFSNLYDQELPFVKETLQAAMKWAQKYGFVRDILGRRQRFSLWEPSNNRDRKMPPLPREKALEAYGPQIQRFMTYAALNRKNQASSATITKKAMVDAWEAGIQNVLGAPLISVHDENVSSVPKTKEGDEAGRELTRIMERVVELKVPLIVDSKRGINWGACDKI